MKKYFGVKLPLWIRSFPTAIHGRFLALVSSSKKQGLHGARGPFGILSRADRKSAHPGGDGGIPGAVKARKIPVLGLIMALLASAVVLTAFTYPLKKIRLTSTFGETRVDHLHNGVDMAGDGEDVRAVLAGQVIFSFDERDYPLDQPLGYGNFVILQHADSYRSYYYHLESGSIPRDLVFVNEGIVIGKVGNSGHSGGSHLHFSIFDLKENKLLNPLAFMRDIPDTRRPTAGKVYYSLGGKNEIEPLSASTVFTQGKPVDLFLKTHDSIQSSPFSLGVYSIEVRTNGGLFYSIVFDSLSIVPPAGVIAMDSLRYSDVYAKPYLYRIGRLTPVSSVTLKVRVADYAKNTDDMSVVLRMR